MLSHQFIMCPFFYDASFFKNNNVVGISHRT